MKKVILILLTLSFLYSCEETPESTFEKDGVYLLSPKGWSISEQEDLGPGYYLAIEKDGFSSSGIMIVMWFEGVLNRTDLINNFMDELRNQWMLSDISSRAIINNKFNSISSLSLQYQGNVFGMLHEGVSHSFHINGKTFYIAKQGAVEDRDINEKGFDLIEKSFRVY